MVLKVNHTYLLDIHIFFINFLIPKHLSRFSKEIISSIKVAYYINTSGSSLYSST